MGVISKVYRGDNDFDFPKTWKPLGILSVVLVLGSLVSLFTQGLNLSIDFEGGSVWEVPSQSLTVEQAEEVMAPFGDGAAERFQEATTSDGVRVLRVSGRIDNIDESQDVAAALAEAADIPVVDVDVTTVGPSWGKDITRTARNSLIIFMVLVTAYMAWRLEPRMAASGILAVLHDVVLTVGFYSVFQFEVSPATVIAFLTILGFSLYDTIVVFDRMQENAHRLDPHRAVHLHRHRAPVAQPGADALGEHDRRHAAPGGDDAHRRRVHLRRADARRLLARTARGARVGRLLLDLRRRTADRGVQGAGAEVRRDP